MSISHVEVNIDTGIILDRLNLQEKGKVQNFFSNEVLRFSDKYVPFNTGALKNSGRVSSDSEAVEYISPYARYLWYGKLMVDPITHKGAFHDPITGKFWSRPGVQKVLTDTDLHFNGGRSAKWVEAMWDNEGQTISNEVKTFILRNSKWR